jgi:pimeloyl-ACP methyl ester carboxylesterase
VLNVFVMRRSVGALLFFSPLLVLACGDEGTKVDQIPPPAAPTPEEKPTTNPQPNPQETNTLEKVSCRFVAPRSVEGKSFYCADVSVPENRRNKDSAKKIKIHVAVIKGKEGGTPTVELVGGPGGSADGMVGAIVAGQKGIMKAYGPILAEGDLVLFDQRGTGRSVPRLSCADEDSKKCLAALEKQDIDVAAYDTIENADDVHDVKVALGVPKINLHGISYGTRLGIEILKRHPDDVRSAILDGVMPSDVPVLGFFEVAMDGVLSKTFAACKADTKCNTTYPNLDQTLTQLKTKLETKPFEMDDPFGPGKMKYDWRAFTSDLIQRAYEEGSAGKVPYWIHDLLKKNQAEWAAAQEKAYQEEEKAYQEAMKEDANNPLMKELFEREEEVGEEELYAADMAQGMYLSVTCNDYAQFETVDAAKAAQLQIRPELRDDDGIALEFKSCTDWAKRPADPSVRNTPSNYAGPALVIGGALDPATPASWAKHVSASLPNDQFFEVPTGGHGLMDECGANLKGTFLRDPGKALDGTCATARSIKFFYEGSGQQFARVNRENVLFSTIAKHPEGTTHMQLVKDRVLAASKPAIPFLGVRHRR